MPTFGSLFAGIGGLDLGLERAGWTCRWQVEIDGFCRRVLAHHWPEAERYVDVRFVGERNLESVDLVCGGFPCQDISNAGKRVGIHGARSGLWWEYRRILSEIRPRYVLIENVSALVGRGLRDVLGSLAELGYACEWDVVGAIDVGAPHLRKRIFVVAVSDTGSGGRREAVSQIFARESDSVGSSSVAHGHGREVIGERDIGSRRGAGSSSLGRDADGRDPDVADAEREAGGEPRGPEFGDGAAALRRRSQEPGRRGGALADGDGERLAFGQCLGGDAREELEAAARGHRAEGGGLGDSSTRVGWSF